MPKKGYKQPKSVRQAASDRMRGKPPNNLGTSQSFRHIESRIGKIRGTKCAANCKCGKHKVRVPTPRSLESRAKQSATVKLQYLEGKRSPPPGSKYSHGQYVFNKWLDKYVWLRSSWEVVFARYCNEAGLAWNYENVRVQGNGKIEICDFEIDGVIYEIGWSNKLPKQDAFESVGWEFHWIIRSSEDKRLMEMFL